MHKTPSCLFCSIIQGKAPVALVYTDNEFVALMDKYPVNHGHTLLIPKVHYNDLLSMPLNQIGRMYCVAANLAKAIVSSVRADGFNLGQNNGRAANQIVPHVHVHIIPRYNYDSPNGNWPSRKVASLADLTKIAESIRNSIAKPLASGYLQ
ncbi:MAG: HIT family protein [Nitrososphaeraceae archaeon]